MTNDPEFRHAVGRLFRPDDTAEQPPDEPTAGAVAPQEGTTPPPAPTDPLRELARQLFARPD